MSGDPRLFSLGAALPNPPVFARWVFFQVMSQEVAPAKRELLRIGSGLDAACVENVTGPLDLRSEHRLERWARTWQLPYASDVWMEPIRTHLRHWYRWPEVAGAWVSPGSFSLPALPAPPQWRPWEQSEAEYLEAHQQYVAAVKARFIPTPTRFTERDFRALVLVLVRQLTVPQVIERLHLTTLDESTIRDRLKALAELLDLPWRPARGRPRRPIKKR